MLSSLGFNLENFHFVCIARFPVGNLPRKFSQWSIIKDISFRYFFALSLFPNDYGWLLQVCIKISKFVQSLNVTTNYYVLETFRSCMWQFQIDREKISFINDTNFSRLLAAAWKPFCGGFSFFNFRPQELRSFRRFFFAFSIHERTAAIVLRLLLRRKRRHFK